MSNKARGAGAAGPPAVCLLHLNFEPCPWCAEIAQEKLDDEVERTMFGQPDVEAAVIDTTPRRRQPRR